MMNGKNVLLLCKGSSVARMEYDDINSHDIISWANIHNDIEIENIPNRLDYLYLRESKFIDELPEKNKQHLKDLKIEQIFSVKKQFDNVIGYKVKYTNLSKSFRFNASTGLMAFKHLCTLNPKSITLVGLDNFQKNKPLYYFNTGDPKKNLTSKQNFKGMSHLVDENNILTSSNNIHHRAESIDEVVKLVMMYQNISFRIISNDELLNEKLNNIINVVLE